MSIPSAMWTSQHLLVCSCLQLKILVLVYSPCHSTYSHLKVSQLPVQLSIAITSALTDEYLTV